MFKRFRQRFTSLLVLTFFAGLVAVPSAQAIPPCYVLTGTVITNASACSGTLEIPSGITGIGYTAFMNSTVETVTGLYDVVSIGNMAFYEVDSLTSITLPPGVISIGEGAFARTKLRSLSLPPTLTSLGVSAFYGIPTLTNISIGPGLTEIPADAFVGSGASSITIPPNIKTIGQRAFKSSLNLTTVTLPTGLEVIGPEAFQYSTNLTTLTVPNTVYSIAATSFDGAGYVVPAEVVTRVEATNTTRLANIASAAAEVVRQQSETARKAAEQQAQAAIAIARTNISQAFKSKSKISRDDLLAASLSGISQKNIAKLQAEIDAKAGGVTSIEDIEFLAKKVVTIESLGGDASTAKRTSTADLSAIGVTGMDSAYKTTILRKIVALPAESRDSFAEIDALAATYLAQSQARAARTAAIIEKIASRR